MELLIIYKDMRSTKNDYVNGVEFRNEIIKSKDRGELTPIAINMLIKMCNEISKKYSYKYKEDREDCVAYAIEDTLRYWKAYNPDVSKNAFGYFTRMIWNGLKKGWRKLYKIKSSDKISLSSNIYSM
jgi:DNA-directed RNA polymerase specialized sigma subunit